MLQAKLLLVKASVQAWWVKPASRSVTVRVVLVCNCQCFLSFPVTAITIAFKTSCRHITYCHSIASSISHYADYLSLIAQMEVGFSRSMCQEVRKISMYAVCCICILCWMQSPAASNVNDVLSWLIICRLWCQPKHEANLSLLDHCMLTYLSVVGSLHTVFTWCTSVTACEWHQLMHPYSCTHVCVFLCIMHYLILSGA